MLTRKKLMWIAVPIVGVSIYAFVYYASKNKDNIPTLPESNVAIESSNTSITINSSNSSNDLNLPAPNPTSTIATQFTTIGTGVTPSTPTGTGVTPSTPTGTGVTSSTPTGTGVTSSTSTGTGVTPSTPTGTGVTTSTPTGTGVTTSTPTGTGVTSSTSTCTSATESTPTDIGTSSNEPISDNSSSNTSSSGYRPVFIPPIYLHATDCDEGWLGLKSDHNGDAYIDGNFLRENRIDKVKNGRKINGWKFNLYIDGASISLVVYSNQGGFSYGTQTIYYETPTYEHPVHITTAEYTENDQLKISFSIEDASLDLTTLDEISVTFSTTPTSSTSSNTPPIYDDYYNGWVRLTDGQTGDAYIYGSFLDENCIGKVVNGHKINGWKINLYTHTVSISLFVYPNQNGFYYRAEQITTYEDALTQEWPVQITSEYTDNSDLIVSFFVEGQAFDLSSLYRVTIETC